MAFWKVRERSRKRRQRYPGYRQDVQGLVHLLRSERAARSARREFEKGMNRNYAGDVIAYQRFVRAEQDAHRSVRLRKMKIHDFTAHGKFRA